MSFQYVYLLESQQEGDHHYVGLTEDLKARLAKHNQGEVPHTSLRSERRNEDCHGAALSKAGPPWIRVSRSELRLGEPRRSNLNFRPWVLKVAMAFREREKAASFERYLKSHSGRAFAKRHF